MLFNSIGYIPFTFLDGIGRSDLNAKIQIFELPLYCILIWGLIKLCGILGVAIAFALRTGIDTILLIVVSLRISKGLIFPKKDIVKISVLSVVLLVVIASYRAFGMISYKILLFGSILGFLILLMRKEILSCYTEQFVYQMFNRTRR